MTQQQDNFLQNQTIARLGNMQDTPSLQSNLLKLPDSSLLTLQRILNNDIQLEVFQDKDKEIKKGKWSKDEDDVLRAIVMINGEKNWKKISMYIKGRTPIQCLHRWSKILRPGLIKGPWTQEEDMILQGWVIREGPNKWAQAAKLIHGRTGKQCRERWINILNPQVKKGDWTKNEDLTLFGLFNKYGSSWTKIAVHFTGRTENSIKNRYYSTLRKIKADIKKKGIKDVPTYLDKFVGNNVQECNNLYEMLMTRKHIILNQKTNQKVKPQKQTAQDINKPLVMIKVENNTSQIPKIEKRQIQIPTPLRTTDSNNTLNKSDKNANNPQKTRKNGYLFDILQNNGIIPNMIKEQFDKNHKQTNDQNQNMLYTSNLNEMKTNLEQFCKNYVPQTSSQKTQQKKKKTVVHCERCKQEIRNQIMQKSFQQKSQNNIMNVFDKLNNLNNDKIEKILTQQNVDLLLGMQKEKSQKDLNSLNTNQNDLQNILSAIYQKDHQPQPNINLASTSLSNQLQQQIVAQQKKTESTQRIFQLIQHLNLLENMFINTKKELFQLELQLGNSQRQPPSFMQMAQQIPFGNNFEFNNLLNQQQIQRNMSNISNQNQNNLLLEENYISLLNDKNNVLGKRKNSIDFHHQLDKTIGQVIKKQHDSQKKQ